MLDFVTIVENSIDSHFVLLEVVEERLIYSKDKLKPSVRPTIQEHTLQTQSVTGK